MTVGYVYMMEFLTPKYKLRVATLFVLSDGLIYLFMTFYFDFISNQYMYCAQIGLCLNLICVFLMIFFVHESPIFLLKTGKIMRAQAIITQIARQNGLPEEV